MRAAVFFTPGPHSELERLAAAWLGRSAFGGDATGAVDARQPFVAEPARYGFHATLKAPFRLAAERDLAEIAQSLAVFCAERSRPILHRLVLARLGSFFALVPAESEPALARLEADVLRAFEPFRARLDEAETAARRPDRLSPRQLDHLHRWGYPFVLDEFRFHMTLTGSLPEDADDVRRQLEDHFAGVLQRPLPLDGLGLFVEPARGAPFHVHAFHPFGSAPAPRATRAP